MLPETVFWSSLAVAFVALVVWVGREYRRIRNDQDISMAWGMQPPIAQSVYRALRAILLIECVAFSLAAAAAIGSAVWS